jgi:hypothetical protein
MQPQILVLMQQTTSELRNTQIQVFLQLPNEATTHTSTYFTILTCLSRVIVIVFKHVGRIMILFWSVIEIVISLQNIWDTLARKQEWQINIYPQSKKHTGTCVRCLCIACAPHQVLDFSPDQQILGTHIEELELRVLDWVLSRRIVIRRTEATWSTDSILVRKWNRNWH